VNSEKDRTQRRHGAPRKLLLTASPIIAVIVAVTVVMFLARRVWRYPLLLIGAAIPVGLGV
jgi:hypothetical protein